MSLPLKKELWHQTDVRGSILNQRVRESSGGVAVGDAAVVTGLDVTGGLACLCTCVSVRVTEHSV